jgi:hypothetical protein
MMNVDQLVEGELAGEIEVLGENLPQQTIPHNITRGRTRAAAVGRRRLLA